MDQTEWGKKIAVVSLHNGDEESTIRHVTQSKEGTLGSPLFDVKWDLDKPEKKTVGQNLK